ncbi:hypothetical protein PEDI_21930 [Persicobacter diffluens]|uniref:Uncharacterized protein n=1 Tax=Persicobacter diffluens TaxID=981 RepID=A0AAN4VX51_9BACT|nr:hypothetical protein PEDI_21930 [Persicobacter diffluens]
MMRTSKMLTTDNNTNVGKGNGLKVDAFYVVL